MLSVCPRCKNLTVEYDSYQRVEKCLNRECGWVNRGKEAQKKSETSIPSCKFSQTMVERVHRRNQASA